MEVRDALFDCAHWPGGPVAVQDGRDVARLAEYADSFLPSCVDLVAAYYDDSLVLPALGPVVLEVPAPVLCAPHADCASRANAAPVLELPSPMIPAPSAGN